jgi:hypothetical protein
MEQTPPNNENPLLFRAVGRLQGIFNPGSDDKPQLGTLTLEDGTQLSAYLPNFVQKKASKRSISLDQPHLWTVYPKTHKDGEIKRVTLRDWSSTAPEPISANRFNICGILEKRTYSPDGLVVRIERNLTPAPGQENQPLWKPFRLTLIGTIEQLIPEQFWKFTVIRQGKFLVIKEAQLLDDRGHTYLKQEPPQLKKVQAENADSLKVNSQNNNSQKTGSQKSQFQKTQSSSIQSTPKTEEEMPIPGKLEITLKINEFPADVETVENNWKHFEVDCNGRLISITVKPKLFKKLEQAQENYPQWVAAISGQMGELTPTGFILEQPSIQVFEKKAKPPKEESTV